MQQRDGIRHIGIYFNSTKEKLSIETHDKNVVQNAKGRYVK
jgi:hypothetical protein